jgi:predicted HAD superfamily Cof-like phosphohydrolase
MTKENYVSYKNWEAVKSFHDHIGVVPDPTSTAQAALRTRLIVEEFAETYKAMQTGDIVEAADGLADLRYVVLGTAIVYDIQMRDLNDEPNPERMLVGPQASLDFGRRVANMLHYVIVELSHAPNIRNLLHGLSRLDAAAQAAADDLGIPLSEIFDEVHRSNMTKSAGGAGTGSKYGPGGKGPNYSPPNVHGILEKAGLL